MNMTSIYKKNEPVALKEFRKKCKKEKKLDRDAYERLRQNYRDGFEELQRSLLEEQHDLCCYCMIKLKNNMTVEHYKPKSKYPELALSYDNLLACCQGNVGNNIHLHCGASKGDKELVIIPNPASEKAESFFSRKIDYKHSGEIAISSDGIEEYSEKDKTLFYKEINEILNLNDELLVKSRREKLFRIIEQYKKIRTKNKQKDFIEKIEYISFYPFIKKCLQRKFQKNHE